MSTAPEADSYLLPLPMPHSPIVPSHLTTPAHVHLNGRYVDAVWSLGPLTANPSTSKRAIHWRSCPLAFRDEMRLAAWNLINGQLRPTFLKAQGTTLRARISLGTIRSTVALWMDLAKWLEARNIRSLAGCDTGTLHDYGQHLLASRFKRAHVQKILCALTRLWAFDQLSGRPTGVGKPPWQELGADDYLPAATTTGGENSTEPLAEQTMGPLLIWAMRLIDLADDILAAWAERQRLANAARTNVVTQASRAALHAYLDPLIAAQAPVPANPSQNGLARVYIGGITGATRMQIDIFAQREGLVGAAALRPGPCPMDIPVAGRIAGRPWRGALDFNEAAMWRSGRFFVQRTRLNH
jgi:hypothetical protein